MRIAAVLPTSACYGGVRRYYEIGNELVRRGHEFILFIEDHESKDTFKPGWFDCHFNLYGTNWVTDKSIGVFDYVIASEYCFKQYRMITAYKRVYYSISDTVNELSLSISDIVTANSTRQIANMKKHGRKAEDWIGGINTDQFKPMQVHKVNPPQVIFHGKWSDYKATGYIVMGIELAAKERVLLAAPYSLGDRINLRCLCESEKYYGLPPAQIPRAYNESTISVAIELNAGWCNAAAESMACGIPVVCGKIGTEDFAVDGENCLIVPDKDSPAIAKAIVKLIDDEALRTKLSANGIKTMESYTWKRVTDKVETTLCV